MRGLVAEGVEARLAAGYEDGAVGQCDAVREAARKCHALRLGDGGVGFWCADGYNVRICAGVTREDVSVPIGRQGACALENCLPVFIMGCATSSQDLPCYRIVHDCITVHSISIVQSVTSCSSASGSDGIIPVHGNGRAGLKHSLVLPAFHVVSIKQDK